jgi:hypothetical protein
VVVLEKNTILLNTYYGSNRKAQFQFLDSFIEFSIETDAKIGGNRRFIDKFLSFTLCSLVEDFQLLKKDVVLKWYENQTEITDFEDIKNYAIKNLKPFIEYLKIINK